MSERNGPGITESHIRAFTATLAIVDEALCEFERWASGHAAKGDMYEEVNDLTPRKRKNLLGGIHAVRESIRNLRDHLGLKPERSSVSHMIWVKCAGYWESLVELESPYLKRYGSLPPDLARKLDAQVTRINRQFRRLSTLVRARESFARTKERDK